LIGIRSSDVVFDTTYKVNSYDMPFGIFVGVNNHGKTILFGCALLQIETTRASRWLIHVKVFKLTNLLKRLMLLAYNSKIINFSLSLCRLSCV